MNRWIITDYINYTLAKSEVPNMYIVEGVSRLSTHSPVQCVFFIN